MPPSSIFTIYNSQTRKKEKFISENNKVGLYVCGVTPYDITHLGHAATYVFFDLVVRYLEYLGFTVTYIQNVTDIDDDILQKAKREKINWRTLGEKNFADFLKDLKWLNIRPPDFFPRATDHIKEIIVLNKILLEKGYAYERKGNLYFNIKKYKQFGLLSRFSESEMLTISRERGNDTEDPNKKNPLDFVLWQAQAPGEPGWDSPWGSGRPGWHIECSSMSMKYLGQTLDIHGGGGDLIYPHHESEIAQSESATGKKFARFFMHTAMLNYQGKKMSKSLGNMVFVRDLKNKYSPNTIRLLLLNHHYRKPWEFTWQELEKSQQLSDLFKKVWLTPSTSGKEMDIDLPKHQFFQALNDDLNTPQAINILKELSRNLITSRTFDISSAKAFLNTCFNILGLMVEY